MIEKLDRRDWGFLAICGVIFAVCLTIGLRWFDRAFPEASIDFRYDRESSQKIADDLLRSIERPTIGFKHASRFSHDDSAKVFLERTAGLGEVEKLGEQGVRLWFWTHRWFKPLEKEELRVAVAPTGEIVSFEHLVPEAEAVASAPQPEAQRAAERFLEWVGVLPQSLTLVATSEQTLPRRTERIFTWERSDLRPGGAPYRHVVTMRGTTVAKYEQKLRVPDAWQREYADMRAKNMAAGAVDQIFFAFTIIAILVVFILRVRRGDLNVKFSLWSGAIAAVLVTAVSLNAFPSALADYDTKSSFAAFVTENIFFSALGGIAAGLLLMVVAGAGEVLYRERFPNHLAAPRLFNRNALGSKRLFKALILGYTLFAAFLAYQVVFYMVATRFGAWSPADVPYDDILNTWFPWVSVIFMGFYPAMSEEFMSRAFSIPFFEKILRSPVAAVLLAGFIWGFGHAAYPNQPFFIRGLEVGIAGVVIGLLMYRFGILPLLLWHYTVDALYTSVLLFRSNNPYYIASAAAASLLFVVPLLISIVLYLKRGGFVPDDALENRTIPLSAAAEASPLPAVAPLPAPIRLSSTKILTAFAALAIAALLIGVSGSRISDVIDYRVNRATAVDIAKEHAATRPEIQLPSRVLALPVSGFRNWDRESTREDGGAPGDYDDVAAEYLLKRGVDVRRIVGIQRDRIEAATWMVRFYTPKKKDEVFVEVDPRTSGIVGFHRYLEETAPGARLPQSAAHAIAERELARFGLDARSFALKEALSFPQPNRTDWLLHFEERSPLGAAAFRRATVRVAGDDVTQFAKTVRIPEVERREAEKRTFLQTFFLALKLIAILGLASLVISGAVVVIRSGGFVWKRAARWTAYLSPLVLLAGAAKAHEAMQAYDTSIAFETFLVMMSVSGILLLALQLGAIFLALAVISAALPYAPAIGARAARNRFGRDAAIAAVAFVAVFVALDAISGILPNLLPIQATLESINIPASVGSAMPIVTALFGAVMAAVLGSAAVVSIGALFKLKNGRMWVIATAIAIALAALQTSISPAQAPLAIGDAILTAVVVMLFAFFVLGRNPLAWPLAIFARSLIQSAFEMMHSSRLDLQIQGGIAVAILGIAIAWFAAGRFEQDDDDIIYG